MKGTDLWWCCELYTAGKWIIGSDLDLYLWPQDHLHCTLTNWAISPPPREKGHHPSTCTADADADQPLDSGQLGQRLRRGGHIGKCFLGNRCGFHDPLFPWPRSVLHHCLHGYAGEAYASQLYMMAMAIRRICSAIGCHQCGYSQSCNEPTSMHHVAAYAHVQNYFAVNLWSVWIMYQGSSRTLKKIQLLMYRGELFCWFHRIDDLIGIYIAQIVCLLQLNFS